MPCQDPVQEAVWTDKQESLEPMQGPDGQARSFLATTPNPVCVGFQWFGFPFGPDIPVGPAVRAPNPYRAEKSSSVCWGQINGWASCLKHHLKLAEGMGGVGNNPPGLQGAPLDSLAWHGWSFMALSALSQPDSPTHTLTMLQSG